MVRLIKYLLAFGLIAAFAAPAFAQDDYPKFNLAPVTEKSGKQHWVHWRMACPKFIRQTFHEFADHSRRWCGWAKAYYQIQIERGKKHNAAVRSLAYKWIRLLFRCWKKRLPYQEEIYLRSLAKHQSPLVQKTAIAVEKL